MEVCICKEPVPIIEVGKEPFCAKCQHWLHPEQGKKAVARIRREVTAIVVRTKFPKNPFEI